MPLARVATATLALVVLAAGPALAAWPHDPYTNLAITSDAFDQQLPVTCSDGAGGIIMAWRDPRNGNYDIFAQRITATGTIVGSWAAGGIPICTVAGSQIDPCITADGSGGAIIAWADPRNGNYDIYAQRVSATGAMLWTVDGVRATNNAQDEDRPTICSDGAGGALLAWRLIYSGTDNDFYGTHLTAATGAIAAGWGFGGNIIAGTIFNEITGSIAPDGAGGAYFSWSDNRGGPSNYDVFVSRYTGAGTLPSGWFASGFAVTAVSGNEGNPRMVADGAGGAIVAWEDDRFSTGQNDIYALRLTSGGARASGWIANGNAATLAANTQYSPVLAADGSGGAIIAWSDTRNDLGDIYTQHLSSNGGVVGGWPGDGRGIAVQPNAQGAVAIVPDGAGGAALTWMDNRNGGVYNLYATRVGPTGNIAPGWASDGNIYCSTGTAKFGPAPVSDGLGGMLVAWQDYRNLGAGDIYAQRIDRYGALGNAEPSITAITDVKADQGGHVRLQWNASYLDADPDFAIGSYWIWRQVPATLAASAVRAGARWADDSGEGARGRLFMRAAQADAAYAWEYLSTQLASGFPAYTYVAPTAADSVTGHNPYTLFMVQARAASGNANWSSNPDSGYSVDNLPPLPPAPFTGAYSSGSTHLHWGANLEGDLGSYRVYRGSSSGFVPGPGNRIVEKPDTGYVDVGPGGSWYKLSAVDVHGNESAFVTLSPDGTLNAPGPGLPAALAFAVASANPARDGARFALALPRDAEVIVAIYDAGGRLVESLARGALPAGTHALTWSGRDRSGRAVEAGLYFARAAVEGRVLVRRIALMP